MRAEDPIGCLAAGQVAPRVLVAGLAPDLFSWLRQRLEGASVEAVPEDLAALDALQQNGRLLLVLDQAGLGPKALELLVHLRAHPGLAALPVLLCLRQAAHETLAHELTRGLGSVRLIRHPLDPEALALQAAGILGVPVPAGGTPKVQATDRLLKAVAGVWERMRPMILARVPPIEAAVAALLEGRLEEDLRGWAVREAHKLAGSLGTFGFPEGSRVAREIEDLLQEEPLSEGSSGARLSELALTLRRILEQPRT